MSWFKYRPLDGPAIRLRDVPFVGCFVAVLVVKVILTVGVIYVVGHFVAKYW